MINDLKTIKLLLEKFYAGETNEGEEAIIADYFATHSDTGEFDADREIFENLYGAVPENVPEGLEQRLEDTIDRMAADEETSRKGMTLWLKRYVMSAAAAVMLCGIVGTSLYKAGLFDITTKDAATATAKETYDNPEMAMQTTEMALMKFSQTLNKGLKPLN